MARREAEPLQRVTINLYLGDLERLQLLHPSIGASKVIRALIRRHILQIEAKTRPNPAPATEIDID